MKHKHIPKGPLEMGREAFDEGLDADSNPFPKSMSDDRKEWFDGYYGREVEAIVIKCRKGLGLEPDRSFEKRS